MVWLYAKRDGRAGGAKKQAIAQHHVLTSLTKAVAVLLLHPPYSGNDAWTLLCVVIASPGDGMAGCFTNPSGSTNTNTTHSASPPVVIITP